VLPQPFTVLEALSATGLRAIRYFKEIPGLSYVVANDLSQDAVHSIERNVLYNGLTTAQVIPHHGDAKYARVASAQGTTDGRLTHSWVHCVDAWSAHRSAVLHAHTVGGASPALDAQSRFTVVDLDPYGSAAGFLDGAVQAVDDGGALSREPRAVARAC